MSGCFGPAFGSAGLGLCLQARAGDADDAGAAGLAVVVFDEMLKSSRVRIIES